MKIQQNQQQENFDNSDIDWQLLAEPQEDQSDTLIVLDFARKRGNMLTDTSNNPTFFDGEVTLSNDAVSLDLDYCIPAPYDHPNIQRACDLVRLWPTVFTQFKHLIESVSVFVDSRNPEDKIVGSISGHGYNFGYIATTVNNYCGFAQALVHEMAHHKLYALGVQIDTAERIIRNSSEQKYRSPVRYDCWRPMPAVLHGQYSFTHVLALEIEIIKSRQEPKRERYIAEHELSKNLARLEFGLKVIQEHAEVDEIGKEFLTGLFYWSNRLFEEAYAILDEFKIPPAVFQHPFDAHPKKGGEFKLPSTNF